MKSEWRKDETAERGRFHVRWMVFQVRWTRSGNWSTTITDGETGRDEIKTRSRFDDLADAMAVADEMSEGLRAEGWTRHS
ncbi:hypothetical protein [Streptomyces sp. NPDC048142]|uniref:hypothetical protein n=1 Tax=Streptomyces sp. NPDC048142 TaxID=3365501 RepID=UPI00371071FD